MHNQIPREKAHAPLIHKIEIIQRFHETLALSALGRSGPLVSARSAASMRVDESLCTKRSRAFSTGSVHWTLPVPHLAKSYQDLTEALRESRELTGQKENTQLLLGVFFLESGSVLLSRAASPGCIAHWARPASR